MFYTSPIAFTYSLVYLLLFSISLFWLSAYPSCWGSWRKYVPWPSSSLPIITLALRRIEVWEKGSRTQSLCCLWFLPFLQNLPCCSLILSLAAANFSFLLLLALSKSLIGIKLYPLAREIIQSVHECASLNASLHSVLWYFPPKGKYSPTSHLP